jgi:hypothetical protein
MMLTGWLVAGLSLLAAQASAQSSPSVLWRARAFEASPALQGIQATLKKFSNDKWNTPEVMQLRCEAMLETAFASHVVLEDIAHKTDGNTDFYHVMLSAGEQRSMFDLVYVYVNGRLVAARIDLLPKGWRLFFVGSSVVQVLVPEGCVFHFDVQQPFAARVSR